MSEAFYNAKNLTVSNGFVRNPDRYYLEEYFIQRPALNAQISTSEDAVNTIIHNVANKNFEILGTNASKDDVTFSSTEAGIVLTDSKKIYEKIKRKHIKQNMWGWYM